MKKDKAKREIKLKHNPNHICPECNTHTSIIASADRGFWCPKCGCGIDYLADALEYYRKVGDTRWLK